MLSLFVTNEESIQAGYARLAVMGYLYIFEFSMAFSAGILRGLKHSNYPMITTLVFCTVIRIILIYTIFPLEMFHTVMWLYALFPITWFFATISNVIALSIFIPKDMKKIEQSKIDLVEESKN